MKLKTRQRGKANCWLRLCTTGLTKAKAKKIIKAYAKRHKLAYEIDQWGMPDIEIESVIDMWAHRSRKNNWMVIFECRV